MSCQNVDGNTVKYGYVSGLVMQNDESRDIERCDLMVCECATDFNYAHLLRLSLVLVLSVRDAACAVFRQWGFPAMGLLKTVSCRLLCLSLQSVTLCY